MTRTVPAPNNVLYFTEVGTVVNVRDVTGPDFNVNESESTVVTPANGAGNEKVK
ncbi:unannotated protein [freshwater metagenome]|uniref:Unannotated protein n=1 Tax=freshwater metagenome TaxID=449393 RepID=A0A6J5ZIX0_9ZZZZ